MEAGVKKEIDLAFFHWNRDHSMNVMQTEKLNQSPSQDIL